MSWLDEVTGGHLAQVQPGPEGVWPEWPVQRVGRGPGRQQTPGFAQPRASLALGEASVKLQMKVPNFKKKKKPFVHCKREWNCHQ